MEVSNWEGFSLASVLLKPVLLGP